MVFDFVKTRSAGKSCICGRNAFKVGVKMKKAPNGTEPKEGLFRIDIYSIASLYLMSRDAEREGGVDNCFLE